MDSLQSQNTPYESCNQGHHLNTSQLVTWSLGSPPLSSLKKDKTWAFSAKLLVSPHQRSLGKSCTATSWKTDSKMTIWKLRFWMWRKKTEENMYVQLKIYLTKTQSLHKLWSSKNLSLGYFQPWQCHINFKLSTSEQCSSGCYSNFLETTRPKSSPKSYSLFKRNFSSQERHFRRRGNLHNCSEKFSSFY